MYSVSYYHHLCKGAVLVIISNHVFFPKKSIVSLSGAYKFFGVKKNSYMGSIVQRIYDYYCGGAINLYRTYRKYYKKEFSSYEEFLERHFNLFPDEVRSISSKHLYYKDTSFQPENNITNLIEDLAIANTVKQFLGDEGADDSED